MHYQDYVPSESTMPYSFGFVYVQSAIADQGFRSICQKFTRGAKSIALQIVYPLFIVLNQQGHLTIKAADDTNNIKSFPDCKASPQDTGGQYLPTILMGY